MLRNYTIQTTGVIAWHTCVAITHPDIREKNCAYGHTVATPLNPSGVTTVSRKYSLTVATHANVVVAVLPIVHYPANYIIKIYYLR
jgi:hypothetical protein